MYKNTFIIFILHDPLILIYTYLYLFFLLFSVLAYLKISGCNNYILSYLQDRK